MIGQIIDTNTNEPLANTALVVFVKKNAAPINGKTKATPFTFSTNADGIFDAVYKSKRGQDIAIAYPDGDYAEIYQYVLWDTSSGSESIMNVGVIKGYSR